MQLICENPYRILGLSNTATDREIAKRVSDLSVYVEMGKEINYNYDFIEFAPLERNIETIKEAERKLEQPKDILLHSLFWFSFDSNNNYIENLNINNRLEIINNIPNNNAFDLHNKAIITLFSKNDFKTIKTGINYFNDFLAHTSFNDFIDKIVSERSSKTYNADDIFFDELLKEIIKTFEPKDILELFKNTHQEEYITSTIIKPIIHNIESEIETANVFTTKYPENAYKFGKKLINNTSENLKNLESILSENDLMFISISNKLAEQILDCSIAYFNENYESNETNIGSNALELAETAKQIAKSSLLKDRIEKNIPNIKAWVERTTCFFCAKKKKTRKNIRIKLHKVTSHSHGSIRYEKIEIGVPRCLNCSIKHKLAYLYAFLLGSGLLGFITYLLLMMGEIGATILIIIGFGFVISLFSMRYFLFSFVYKFSYKIIIKYFIKIKSKKDISDYKPINDLITMKNGWKIGAKPEF
jgi:hypothetical protein